MLRTVLSLLLLSSLLAAPEAKTSASSQSRTPAFIASDDPKIGGNGCG